MLVADELTLDRSNAQGIYFDGSLELLRELAVTNDVDAALPRLSAIVRKMVPHDALRMACFDRGGHLIVDAWTADVPEMMTAAGDDVIIDDLRTRPLGASAAPHTTEGPVGAGYRSLLGVSTNAPGPLVRLAFWSKQPLAFSRAHVPLARWIAYHLAVRGSYDDAARFTDEAACDRTPRVDARGHQGVDRLKATTQLQVVCGSVEWGEVLR